MKIHRVIAFLSVAAALIMAGEISVENAYVKEVAPNMKNSAAFMTIKNGGQKAVNLVSATNDVSAITELHTHGKKDGMMVMYKVDKIEVPAKGEALLKPMGLHVMLIGLSKQVKEGESVNIELKFDNGESVKIVAPVKKLAGQMKPYMDTHK